MGVSGANIYPTLLSGGDEKIITLGSPLKLEHKAGATLDKFKSNLPMIYAQYTVAIGNLMNLLKIEIDHPVNCLLGVCKRIGVGKKLAFRAAELFEAPNGDTPCTAHDVYYGISEVIFMLHVRIMTQASWVHPVQRLPHQRSWCHGRKRCQSFYRAMEGLRHPRRSEVVTE